MIKVGVVGATGYTGVELLRLLLEHPQVEITVVTSRAEQGVKVSQLFPALRGLSALEYCDPDDEALYDCDIVFYATPHAVSMHTVPKLIEKNIKIIDLSADYRIKDVALWEQWYGVKHSSPQLLERAVYGLPEINREHIKTAQLIACAGCYPTSVQLGLLPLLSHQLIDTQRLVANVASGVSGAGRRASVANLFAEINESYKAYAASGHRHGPEIRHSLNQMFDIELGLTFVPHLLPMTRGILATLYAYPVRDVSAAELQQLYESYYNSEAFVDVMPAGSHPETRTVRGSNNCRIAVHIAEQTGQIVILSALDNLLKGASGQAVQCMNIALGIDELTGLQIPTITP